MSAPNASNREGWIRWALSLWPVLASVVAAVLWANTEIRVLRIKIGDLEFATSTDRERLREHEFLNGHVRIDERVDQLTRRVDILEQNR